MVDKLVSATPSASESYETLNIGFRIEIAHLTDDRNRF